MVELKDGYPYVFQVYTFDLIQVHNFFDIMLLRSDDIDVKDRTNKCFHFWDIIQEAIT